MEIGKSIEISFGAKDSELKGWEYTIPEGMEAEIKDGKIIVREKESEDEKIRKALIWCVETIEGELECHDAEGIAVAELKSWLKKQGDKAFSVERVFAEAGIKPAYKDGNSWCVLIGENIQEGICGFGETPKDAYVNFLKELWGKAFEQKPAWSEEDGKMIRIIEDAICTNEAQQLVKTKYGLELTNLADWLERQRLQNLANSAKTCKNEQNSAWSEEDEKTTQRIVDTIMKYAISPHSIINGDKPNLEYAKEFESWLKSLKFRIQPQWKPSDEQMKQLGLVVELNKGNLIGGGLMTLFNDLKKLKG